MRKKLGVAVLATTLVFGGSSLSALAAGKGKGLETAPGQSENFSKGISTELITTQNVTEDVIIDKQTATDSDTVTKETITTKDYIVVEEKVENHPTKNESRIVKVKKYLTDTTTATWDETTTTFTTTTTTTPVTITETIETLITHQGAPGSNGKVLSEASTSKINEVKGEPVSEVSVTSETSKGEVSVSTKTTTNKTETETTGWAIGQN